MAKNIFLEEMREVLCKAAKVTEDEACSTWVVLIAPVCRSVCFVVSTRGV